MYFVPDYLFAKSNLLMKRIWSGYKLKLTLSQEMKKFLDNELKGLSYRSVTQLDTVTVTHQLSSSPNPPAVSRNRLRCGLNTRQQAQQVAIRK
jgi:hypothetical protein